jgi:DNA-binding NtrC family response regulator
VHDQSKRCNGPLISVNCAAIPETLIESELFGHEKGAFTGANANRKGLVEAADGGTLFLDEIGELPMEAQARLLRLLQEKEVRRVGSVQSKTVDVRLVAATHRNLKFLAKEGRFREDLYYRLHVVELKLPPLRERGADVEKLAQEMLIRTARRLAKQEMSFTAEALRAINSYRWPGNVRELENAIERAVILCDGQIIAPDLMALDLHSEPEYDLDDDIPLPKPRNSIQKHAEVPDPAEDLSLEDYFQRFVLEHQDQMTETELAQKLGISRKCLWERRQRLGIPRKKPIAR